MALSDPKEVQRAREKVREREMQPFRQAAEAGRASRETREAAATEKEGAKESERDSQRKGLRSSA
jgi:hypothetical protein